jgi:hypothetical protein
MGDGTDAYRFYNFVSGEAMRIDSSGNVGIGTSSPSAKVDIRDIGGRTIQLGANPITGYYGSSLYMSVDIGSTEKAFNIGTKYSATGGNLVFEYSTNDMGRDGDASALTYTERMRIDSSGNLLVGKTSSGLANAGIEATASNILRTTKASSASAEFNRTGTDGDIAIFWKDTSPVGSIGVSGGTRTYIGNNDSASTAGLSFVDSIAIYPFDSYNQVNTDNTLDLGTSFAKFKDLYLAGGAYLGGTAAANKLDDYEEGTWTPTITSFTGTNPTVSMTASGTYTKIGRFVTINVFMDSINVTGTKTNLSMISGLPFTVDSSGSGSWVANGVTMARPNQCTPLSLGTGLGFLSTTNGGGWAWETNTIYPSSGTGAMRITYPYFTTQ